MNEEWVRIARIDEIKPALLTRTMPPSVVGNDLRNAVRSALSSLASGRGAAPIDVCRAMRDVSNLLFEERAVLDALDSDPFGVTRVIGSGDCVRRRRRR